MSQYDCTTRKRTGAVTRKGETHLADGREPQELVREAGTARCQKLVVERAKAKTNRNGFCEHEIGPAGWAETGVAKG